MTKKVDRFTCVGCGFCCSKAPCVASVRLYPGVKICPQLIWAEEDNRYICGLMTIPGLVGQSYRKELYANEGCCTNLNSWRHDVKDRKIQNKNLLTIDKLFQIFLRCLGEQFIIKDVIELTLMKFEHMLKKDSITDSENITELVRSYMDSNRPSYLKEFM